MSLASSIQALQRQVVEDLSTAGDLLGTALRSGTLPSRADVPPSVITTSAYTLAIATLSVLMLNSRSRKLIWDVIETLLATALLLVLLVVVLGLPFGAVYISFKGVAFFSSSLMQTFPRLQALVQSVLRNATAAAA